MSAADPSPNGQPAPEPQRAFRLTDSTMRDGSHAVYHQFTADHVRAVVGACEQAERVINELDELLETGFGSRESGRVEEMANELNRIESGLRERT